MILTINTESKTILFSGCEISEAVHFARLHELDDYEIKEAYPIHKITYKVNLDNGFIDHPEGCENESILKLKSHIYTEIDGFGYYFMQVPTFDPTKRV